MTPVESITLFLAMFHNSFYLLPINFTLDKKESIDNYALIIHIEQNTEVTLLLQ